MRLFSSLTQDPQKWFRVETLKSRTFPDGSGSGAGLPNGDRLRGTPTQSREYCPVETFLSDEKTGSNPPLGRFRDGCENCREWWVMTLTSSAILRTSTQRLICLTLLTLGLGWTACGGDVEHQADGLPQGNSAGTNGGSSNGSGGASAVGASAGWQTVNPDSAATVPGQTCTVDLNGNVTCTGAVTPTRCDSDPMPYCISSCYTSNPNSVDAVCNGSLWHCPTGYVDNRSCPTNSCAVAYQLCCNSADGTQAPASCDADGFISQCPAGSSRVAEMCKPDSINVTNCPALNKTTCPDVAMQCHKGEALCTCEADATSGLLNWACVYFLI